MSIWVKKQQINFNSIVSAKADIKWPSIDSLARPIKKDAFLA